MQPTEKTSIDEMLYNYLEQIRPPEYIRSKLDIGYDFNGKEIFIHEIRPNCADASIINHYPYAKIRCVQSQQVWKLYWHRASGKWNGYEPFPQSTDLQILLDCIDEDKYGCFKG